MEIIGMNNLSKSFGHLKVLRKNYAIPLSDRYFAV